MEAVPESAVPRATELVITQDDQVSSDTKNHHLKASKQL